MGQAPCSLCGYQRAFIFPLTVILAVACLQSDPSSWMYACRGRRMADRRLSRAPVCRPHSRADRALRRWTIVLERRHDDTGWPAASSSFSRSIQRNHRVPIGINAEDGFMNRRATRDRNRARGRSGFRGRSCLLFSFGRGRRRYAVAGGKQSHPTSFPYGRSSRGPCDNRRILRSVLRSLPGVLPDREADHGRVPERHATCAALCGPARGLRRSCSHPRSSPAAGQSSRRSWRRSCSGSLNGRFMGPQT